MPVPSSPTPYTPHTFEHQDHLEEVLLRTLSKGKESVSGPSKAEDHTSQGKRLGAKEAPPLGAEEPPPSRAEEAPPSGVSRHGPSLLFGLLSGSTAVPCPPRERGSWELQEAEEKPVRHRGRFRDQMAGGERGGGGGGQRLRRRGGKRDRQALSQDGAARGQEAGASGDSGAG